MRNLTTSSRPLQNFQHSNMFNVQTMPLAVLKIRDSLYDFGTRVPPRKERILSLRRPIEPNNRRPIIQPIGGGLMK